MKIFKPFEKTSKTVNTQLMLGWLIIVISFWFLCALGDTHIFPTPRQVGSGFSDLYYAGLVKHIFSSLALVLKAVGVSIIVSLIICYLSPIPVLRYIAIFLSKLRYLPLTGISFYIGILIHEARAIQVWVLVVFMTTYLTTSLMSMIKDIPEEEFDHARTLGCNRWEILWEVLIKGRFDYVIEFIRQNFAIIWMFVVTVESILPAAGGIGFLIKNNDKLGDSGKVIALQIVIIVIGVLLDFLLTKSRKLAFRFSNF
jgi:NitT/TauT family transport system permease protein